MGYDIITNEQKARILELTIKALDSDITPAEAKELEVYISSSKALAAYYSTCIKTHLCMVEFETSPCMSQEIGNPALDREFWQMLAIHEKTSPEVEMPQEEPPRERIRSVKREKYEYKIHRSSLYAIFASIAAILLLILFVHYAPPRDGIGIKVARLTDSIGAKWADIEGSMEIGASLATSKESLLLREGYAELLFDNNAQITLEGPAEFQIVTADQIALKYGRLYADIPSGAIGFTVTTPNSKIIDLGTKFGVEAGLNHITELHVLKGRTTLISGNTKNKVSLQVTEGNAERISGPDGDVTEIKCDLTKFVRKIHSQDKHIWRGENLSLASIVAGHDGFQEVGSLIGINPALGKYTTSIIRDNRASKQLYNPVPDSKYIDGVFVPDGEKGTIPITSTGHTFECPDTGGLFTHEIAAYKGDIESQHTTIPPAVFNGKKYNNNPVVMLHSNIGITLDLQAIRQSLPGLNLKSFKAWGGLTEALSNLEKDRPDIDFWVLVDGQVKYEKKMLKIDDGVISFNVELKPTDRFLTLIVTDGLRAADGKREFPYSNDFFYLVEPEMCLTDTMR